MNVGIIGAGTMGAGIAQVFAQTEGYAVLLCDISFELAERGKERIVAGLNKRVQKGKLTEADAHTIQNRILTGLKEDCNDCDLIVEAAVENMEIKKQTFAALDAITKPSCLFATNTSSLSVTEIGQVLSRPVIGMHFFNPAPVMKLVEVIKGANASDEAVEAVRDIALSIGKTPILVQEAPGFVVNRLLIPMINEAILLYSEGVASAEDIDSAMLLGANHPIGPLALADMIGLDVVLAIMEVLQRETGDPKYRPAVLLKKMVRAGQLGKKSGRGFYQY